MKKLIAASVIVLAGAAAVGPKVIGGKVQGEYNYQFERIPEHAGINYEHRDFSNGWFSSHAVTAMSMAFGVPELDAIKAVMDTEISHGPLMNTAAGFKTGFAFADSEIRIEGLPQEADAFINEHFNGVPVTVQTTTGFDMLMRSEMNMPGFTVDMGPEQGSIEFGGIAASGVSDREGQEVSTDITMNQIVIKDPTTQITVAESSGSFAFSKYNDFIMLGGGKYTMPSIDVATMLAPVKLENFSIDIQAEEQEGKINFKEIIAVEKVTAPLPVTGMSYELEVNKLAPAGIEAWYKFSNDMNKQMMQQAQQASSAAAPQAPFDEAALRELVSAVLTKDLQLNQLLVLEAMGGKVIADLDVTYLGLADGTHPMDVEDPMVLLQALDVDVLIEADEAPVMQTPVGMMVGPYIQQGFVVQENGKLVTRAKIQNGQMTLNGQPFPIEMLLGAAMGGGDPQGEPQPY